LRRGGEGKKSEGDSGKERTWRCVRAHWALVVSGWMS
jgi:hypothetical protein